MREDSSMLLYQRSILPGLRRRHSSNRFTVDSSRGSLNVHRTAPARFELCFFPNVRYLLGFIKGRSRKDLLDLETLKQLALTTDRDGTKLASTLAISLVLWSRSAPYRISSNQ